MYVGHELTVIGNGSVPRPEEDRLTQTEKSERLNQQLKVSIIKQQNPVLFVFCLFSVMLMVSSSAENYCELDDQLQCCCTVDAVKRAGCNQG